MRDIIIHYYREDQDYEPWGVWLWPEGYGGQWVPFIGEDDYGRIAQCQVAKEHLRLGFLVRGASWEKDIDQDRYLDSFIGNLGEVWLIAGDPKVYLAPPAHLRQDVRAFGELEIVFHYYRYDGDYSGWNLWIWDDIQAGRSLEFVGEDEYGYVARTILRQQTDGGELGFVIRQSIVGNLWVQKDGTRDRYLPFYRANQRGKLEVWLMQDDPKLYYQAQDVDRQPRLIHAFLDDLTLIRIETYLPVSSKLGENWGFQLLNSKGEQLEIAEVKVWGQDRVHPKHFALRTQAPLNLEEAYFLEHSTHGNLPVSFGQVYSNPAFQGQFHYSGTDLGTTYSPHKTTFKVWSPPAQNLEVVIYASDQGGKGRRIPMIRRAKGVWEATVYEDLEGLYYNFLVTHGGKTVEAVDPYAKSTGVNGERGQIVDLSKTNPPGWEKMQWLPLKDPVDAIIYEVHVRDFSSSPTSGIKAKGKYLGMIEEGTKTPTGVMTGLDHLTDLGVTHVHLLPIFDFATVNELTPEQDYNWGYDPLNYNVPEGSYASDPHDGRVRIRELKDLILNLNRAGMGVIMDVVYNHTFHSTASNLNKLVPGYYYRLYPDGRFSNGSGCGNELADERSMVRKFIVDSITYWATEYKLAGFRFDLMGLHHLETMQTIQRTLDELNPEYLLYGEGWAAASSTLPEDQRAVKRNTPQLSGIASFCNDYRDGIKGHVFNTREPGFIQGGGYQETVKFGIVGAIQHPQIDYHKILYSAGPWALTPGQSVSYVEAHDNLTLWDKLLCTTEPQADGERVALMKLAHVLVLTSQGIPFLHAGQDFARTKGGDPNSYQSPDHVNQIDWERKGEFLELYEYTKGLIQLRKERPAFRIGKSTEVREKLRFLKFPNQNVLGFTIGPHANGDSYETILVLVNSNLTPAELLVAEGPWEILANQDQVGGKLGELVGPTVWVEARSALILAQRGRRNEKMGSLTI